MGRSVRKIHTGGTSVASRVSKAGHARETMKITGSTHCPRWRSTMRSYQPAVLLLCRVFCLLLAGCTVATPVPVISGGEEPILPTDRPIPTEDLPDNTI